MTTKIPQIVPPNTLESVSPDAAAPKPQAPQNTELTADQPPIRVGGYGEPPPKSRRGFAGMDQMLVRKIARMGGKAAHSAGRAHEFTSEEARIAGRKGGRASHVKRLKKIEEEYGDLRPRDGKQPNG